MLSMLSFIVQYSFCSEQTHSALVFLPIDANATTENGAPKIVSGSIRGILHTHATIINLMLSPSDSWPSNMTAFLETSSFNTIVTITYDYLYSAIAAASGGIVITPDYIGYGESYKFNRTYSAPELYEQASVLVREASDALASRIQHHRLTLCILLFCLLRDG